MITRLATNPHAFVERQSKYPGIRTQSLIAFLVGVAFGLQHIGLTTVLGSELEHVSGPIWVLTVVDLVVPFVLWGVVTVLIYYTARLVGGYFQIGLLFRMVGWGFAPLIASGFLVSLARLYALQGAAPPEEPSFSAFEYEYAAYQSYVDAATNEPVFLGATAVAAGFALLSGYIWAIVIEHLSGLSFTRALAVSALPVALCLVWIGWQLV
ncbi:YIP1 family protein [Natrononativus amylolyticus]|uniref:YIP1 family protein n=1 Tax=Natrononativus amylolyticus TaxID=2963434 RepID=UPI0020CC4976|nr:YIP1 family protein [Natrononativus amylolyticus]